MEDLALKILMMIIGTAISVGIGMMLWKIRKANGKDEDREKRREERELEMRDQFIKMQTEFNRMKEDWKEKNVDKAYDSAKRIHHRIDDLKSDFEKLKNSLEE